MAINRDAGDQMFSPTKLDDGAWGARIRTQTQETAQLANGRVGQEVTIQTKAGRTFTKRLARVVERRTYCTIYATADERRLGAGHTANGAVVANTAPVEDPEAELAQREGANMTGEATPERMAQIDANYQAARAAKGEPDEANLDTIQASEVGWMITTVSSALSCAAGEYDLPADDIERVKAIMGVLIADGIEHGRVIA